MAVLLAYRHTGETPVLQCERFLSFIFVLCVLCAFAVKQSAAERKGWA